MSLFSNREDIRAQCEKLGPTRVKELLSNQNLIFANSGSWLLGNEHIAKVWLEELESKKSQELKLTELSIAKEANRIASEESIKANKIATTALIISTIALLKDLPWFKILSFTRGILHL